MGERKTGPTARKPSPLAEAIAAQLRAERAAARVTLNELEGRCGLPRGTLMRLFNYERTIDVSQLAAICDGLAVDVLDVVRRAQGRI